MMSELQVSQHNMASCSITAAGDILFVCTSNGVDEAHSENLPSPNAPSFLAMDKNTGRVLWHDNSPGTNVLHGQWSSPAYAVLGGVPQVLFAGGDGWLYSFRGEATPDGKPELLWKFDCNPKESKYSVSSSSTRNHLIGTPVVYDGLVYIAVGEDPEHGEGNGHLWCIDPTKRGDVSSELAFNVDDRTTPIPHRRLQAVIPQQGEIAVSNPNSAAVWHYTEYDWNGDGEIEEFEEKMHRTCGTVAIKDDLLFIPDFSGLFHCLDAKTGEVHWTYDLYAATWGSAMIVEDKVYVGDEEGKVSIFRLSADPDVAMQKDDKGKYQPIAQVEMGNAVYSTPVVANNVLYIANKTHLFAIQEADDRAEAAGSRHGESAEQP
jgi:outer membrane protein assembly factor BamB